MTIRRVDSEETDEARETRETQEREKEEARVRKEEERDAKLRELELANARAESALEEARRRPESAAPTGPTEAQWQDLEAANPGKTRAEIQAEANKMAAMADARLAPMRQELQDARDLARKAQERTDRLESRRSLDKVEDRFYKDNAPLEPHKAEVEAFLAEFPDADKVEAKVYEKRLKMAGDYVRGKVKTLRSEPRRGEFSSRQVEGEEREDREGEYSGRFDPKGTGGNRGAIALMETVADSFGRDTKHEDSVEVWKKSRDEEDRGVQIDSAEEVSHARRVLARGANLGGKRGEI